MGTAHIVFLVLGPEYIQRLLSTNFRGQFYVQEQLGPGRQTAHHEVGFAPQPIKDYTSRLGDFDIVVVVVNHFSEQEVREIKTRSNGKTVFYDEGKGLSLRALIEQHLAIHPQPVPADLEA